MIEFEAAFLTEESNKEQSSLWRYRGVSSKRDLPERICQEVESGRETVDLTHEGWDFV